MPWIQDMKPHQNKLQFTKSVKAIFLNIKHLQHTLLTLELILFALVIKSVQIFSFKSQFLEFQSNPTF